jgi:hypothetical protein
MPQCCLMPVVVLFYNLIILKLKQNLDIQLLIVVEKVKATTNNLTIT